MIRFITTFLAAAWLSHSTPLLAVDPDSPKAPDREEQWQVIAMQGQRIGYGHTVREIVRNDAGSYQISDSRLHTVIKRFDGVLTLIIDQHLEEELDGRLRSFRMTINNPPASYVETTGRVDGTRLTLQTTSAGQSSTRVIDVPEGVKSPNYPEQSLENASLNKGETRHFRIFDPQLNKVVRVTAQGAGETSFELPDGRQLNGSKVVFTYQDGIPGLTVEVYTNAKGKVVYNHSPLIRTSTWSVSKETALEEIPTDIDVGLAALLKVGKLPNVHQARQATYRLLSKTSFGELSLPSQSSQRCQRINDKEYRVQVYSLSPGGMSPPEASRDQAPSKQDVAASAYCQTGDAKIQALAKKLDGAGTAPAEIAMAAEKLVHNWLTNKNMASSFATAAEIARSREGDCTEHAVLLTAILRARHIPARVAVGLVYAKSLEAFVGHAWTEAWIQDRWVPLDATLAQGRIGVGHIKITESSLADGDAGLLQGAVSTWRLLDSASIELVELKSSKE